MSKEIIYSFKEYQEKYNSSLDKYFLEYKEIEEIDFINVEIEKYNICLRLVNFPIDKIFNTWWRVEYGINLKSFTISQEAYDFIFADENDDYYYKIYNDIVETSRESEAKIGIEQKIKQVRLMFPKILSFLENKKSELETNLITIPSTVPAPENDLNKTIENVEFLFNNEFDNVNNVNVYNYFKKELVDKNYLSLEDLQGYLTLAFEKKELPKAKFIFKQNRTLKVIRVIFYNYFKNIAYKPNGKQPEYVKLLTDYFQGFEYEKVKNNFNK